MLNVTNRDVIVAYLTFGSKFGRKV